MLVENYWGVTSRMLLKSCPDAQTLICPTFLLCSSLVVTVMVLVLSWTQTEHGSVGASCSFCTFQLEQKTCCLKLFDVVCNGSHSTMCTSSINGSIFHSNRTKISTTCGVEESQVDIK